MNVYLPNLRLPSTYQEVEYIQSSGTQYIILGTSFKTSYKVVIDFQMTVIGGDYIPLGIKYSTTRYGIDAYESTFKVNGGGTSWTNTITEDTNRHTITIDKGTAIVDGNNYSVSYTNYTFSQGIGVFCYNEYDKSPQYNYKSSNKLYKLDIYDENGSHIYDLVPCYRKSDNVIGLYDLVNNQFYTNSGTGTFSKGNDVTMTVLKNAYIGEVYEYSYDFRNKTTTQLANDGWTNTSGLVTGSDGISYNGWHQCLNTVSGLGDAIASAKKITLNIQTYISSTSNTLAGLALFHDTNGTAESGFYYDNTNFVVNANASIVYSQAHSKSTGIKNITCVFDLVNKTFNGNYVGGNGAFSGTLTDSQIAEIRTCGIARLVTRLYSYTQTIKITVE